MKERTTFLTAVLIFFGLLHTAAADEFYAYYTQLPYVIPIDQADYIPTELDVESRAILKAMENPGEEEDGDHEIEQIEFEDLPKSVQKAARKEYPNQPLMGVEINRDEDEVLYIVMFEVNGVEAGLELTPDGDIVGRWRDDEGEEDEGGDGDESGKGISGKYADIVVNVAEGRQLIFAREFSYLPYWKTEKGRWFVKELVPRQKDVACVYSYVRIIENTPDFVLIHWRYIPNLDNPSGLTGAVHEYFKVHLNGKVIRRIKSATDKLVDYHDPANAALQTLMLKSDGIEHLGFLPAKLSKQKQEAIPGALVKPSNVGSPAAWWRFDEGLTNRSYEQKDLTRESISGKDCVVHGNITLWKKGVSGTALAFDGYHSAVRLPDDDTPNIKDKLTLESWVVLGAYPWNWAPLIHQSAMDVGPIERGVYDEHGKRIDRKPGRGYYLGLDGYGYPIF